MDTCLTILALIAIFFIIFKLWLKYRIVWVRSKTTLDGKTVIITGANRGLGYFTALDFAKRGARVILACRENKLAEEAKRKIIKQSGNKNVVVKIVDLASLKSVREFTKDIRASEERLDILINNAAIVGFEDIKTEDGLNLYMQTNYFAPFLLTLLVLGLLKKSTPSRIVNLTSIAHQTAKLDIDNMNYCDDKATAYSNSKLCNILFTNTLAKKLKCSGISVNAVNPGYVTTDIFRHLTGIMLLILTVVSKLFFNTAEEGAQTSIYAAVAKETEQMTGEHLENCAIKKLNIYDEELEKKIWDKSETFVKLTEEERKEISKYM